MEQWVKGSALLQLWRRLQLWHGFSLWPRELLHAEGVARKKKKKKKKLVYKLGSQRGVELNSLEGYFIKTFEDFDR